MTLSADVRMAQRRVEVTIDLGAGAAIEVVRQLIDDLDTVCQFGGELQYQAAVAAAELAIRLSPADWVREVDFERYRIGSIRLGLDRPVAAIPAVPAAILAPAVSRYLEANNSTQDTISTVESIRYSNPIEIVLGVGIVALLALRTVRDWPARRRVNAATAADVQNQVLARKLLRDEIVRRVLEGDISLSAAQVDAALTLDVAGAMSALGDSRFSMKELDSGK